MSPRGDAWAAISSRRKELSNRFLLPERQAYDIPSPGREVASGLYPHSLMLLFMARRAPLPPCITSPMSAELGNSQIAALWMGGFGLTPILLPCNTPWSRGKHLGGLASCPGRTGEGVLS